MNSILTPILAGTMPLVLIFASTQLCLASNRPMQPKKVVRLAILEALASLDSSSSDRYRQSFEGALNYSLGENEQSLSKCGYRLSVSTSYFENSNKMAVVDAATKLEATQPWIIFGPRRSDQFVAATKSLKQTPIVSPMAGSNQVMQLSPPRFTMYPAIDMLTRAAIEAVKKENFGTIYGSFIDGTCSSCKDFQASFKRQAGNKFIEVFTIDAAGETPNTDDLIATLATKQVDFLLLPNYSKFSGFTISKIQSRFPNLKIVGSDGWGDGQSGFLEEYHISKSIRGISVRGGRSPQAMQDIYQVYSLTREQQGEVTTPPYTAFGVIDFVRKLRADLCAKRPRDISDFRKVMIHTNREHFRSRSGIGIYLLSNGKLQFGYPAGNQ